MKNPFLFLIFFLIITTTQAQDIAWIKNTFQTGTDSLTAVQKATEMAKLAGLKFIKKVDKTPKYAGYYFADTTKKMDTPPQAIFKIYKTQVGANIDLGRTGETQFFVSADILGSFLGLFPMYQKYLDPKADLEKSANEWNLTAVLGSGYIGSLMKQGAIWTLTFNPIN